MSNDLKSVSPELKDILQNEEVIAVDQVSKVNLKPNNSLLAVNRPTDRAPRRLINFYHCCNALVV